MNSGQFSRRRFLGQAAVAVGTAVVAGRAMGQAAAGAAAPAAAAGKRTASDLVTLGKTGLKLSRLGVGLGSSNGQVQASGGQEKFNAFIKHAFDAGITFFDTAGNYATLRMMGPALKGLPREKIFLQSKIEQPNSILDTIDNQRKTFNTDYVDSMLVHIQYRANWTETWKKAMDDYNTALEKKWIKSKGVSCHSLPALRAAVASDWTQVHLVRINPQGYRIDTEAQSQDTRGPDDIKPVLVELKKIREKGRGVIGMKIFGGGALRTEEEREKSLKYVMAMPEVDAVTIGFSSTEEIDQGVKLMNKVLGELG
jgi:1-deoxyxylulose-5-phosphate synthase